MNGLNRVKGVALLLVFLSALSLSLVCVQPAIAVEDSWATKTAMLTGRSGLGVAVANGKIYAIGGDGGSANEEYDPATDIWTAKKSMPTGRSRFGIAVYRNKIYVMGGATTSGFTATNEVYDPLTDTWETKNPMPAGGRSELTVNVVNGKIYAIGGRFLGVYGNPSNLTEVYDPETNSWTAKAQMPTAVYGCTSAVVNNKIFVIENSYSGEISNFRLNQIYDAETDTWSYGKPIPNRAPEAAAAATTGVYAPKRIYVIGGGELFSFALNQIYDPATDTWAAGTLMPTPRQGLGVAVVNDTLYAIGGFNGIDYLNVNEQYTPVGYGTVPPELHVLSPESKVYNVSSVPLVFSVNKPTDWVSYSLDDRANVTFAGNTILAGLSEGNHSVTGYANDTLGNIGSSNPVYFSVDTVPPIISVLLPENKTYDINEIQFNFTANEPVSWVAYSLDGEANVTIDKNFTLMGMADGSHHLTVYAKDMVENIGVSETIYFSIEPFPATLVVAGTAAAIIVATASYLLLKRRKSTAAR